MLKSLKLKTLSQKFKTYLDIGDVCHGYARHYNRHYNRKARRFGTHQITQSNGTNAVERAQVYAVLFILEHTMREIETCFDWNENIRTDRSVIEQFILRYSIERDSLSTAYRTQL